MDECDHPEYGQSTGTSSNCVKLFCEGGGPRPSTGTLIHNPTSGIVSVRY
jgi:hypothetical protein